MGKSLLPAFFGGAILVQVAAAAAQEAATSSARPESEVQETIKSVQALRHDDAGTELFVLATNFLLYIALVILTILMQRAYFPHTLDDANAVHHASAEDDEREAAVAAEFGECNPLDDGAEAAALMKGVATDGGSDGGVALSGALESLSGGGGGGGKLHRENSYERLQRDETFLNSMVDFTNYDTERMSKKAVLQRLLTCAIGLNVSFLVCGVLQERMLTRPYEDGEFFESSYGLVFLNRLGGFIISLLLWWLTAPSPTHAIFYEFSFPSVSNMLSSWCQYEALKYVSFPTQMLFKCFKLAPIMLMGKALGNKSYPAYDYAVALLIGLGIALFMVSTEPMNFGFTSMGGPETWSGTMCGLMLLAFFLCFDSFTGQWQSRMFHRHSDLTPVHMMLMVNAFSLVFSFITLMHTHELDSFMDFLVRHPEMHMHVVVFSVGNTIGQIFIFQTIRSFGAVVFAIVMNTRIILSILTSCLIYSHNVSSQGMFGLFIVFASVGYRIKRKTTGTVIKWREQREQGKDWFKEVHEHMDM